MGVYGYVWLFSHVTVYVNLVKDGYLKMEIKDCRVEFIRPNKYYRN